jgi:hypothetical protein
MKSVVFCSSVRFKRELAEFIGELKRLAAERGMHPVVLEPNFEDRTSAFEQLHEKDRPNEPNYKETVAGKVYDHLFRKVRVADVCFIFNKNGYLGANTNGELFAAAMAGKMCYALHPQTLMGSYPNDLYEELSSRKLIHEVVSTPEELLKRLA